MSDTDSVREHRLRRAAHRQGLLLAKSRRRNPGALGYGTYQLVDAETMMIAHADHLIQQAFGLNLDDVEGYLNRAPIMGSRWAEAEKPPLAGKPDASAERRII